MTSKGEAKSFYAKRGEVMNQQTNTFLGEDHVVLRLVAVQCAIPCVSSLTVALIGGGSVDAGGKGMTVVKSQSAFLNIRAGGVGPNSILLFTIQVLQLHLHFQGTRGGRGLGLRARRSGQRWKLNRQPIFIYLFIYIYLHLLSFGSIKNFSFSWFDRQGI